MSCFKPVVGPPSCSISCKEHGRHKETPLKTYTCSGMNYKKEIPHCARLKYGKLTLLNIKMSYRSIFYFPYSSVWVEWNSIWSGMHSTLPYDFLNVKNCHTNNNSRVLILLKLKIEQQSAIFSRPSMPQSCGRPILSKNYIVRDNIEKWLYTIC